MKVVSNNIKTALKQPKTTRKGRIKVNGTYYDVYNVKYYADCYDEGNVIGNAIASQLDFDLPYIEKFNKFEYEDGVWTGTKFEYVNLGEFEVFDESDNDKFFQHIVAFDNLIRFNKPFIDKNDYPKTMYQELQNVCQQANIVLLNTSIINGNFIIENNQFVGGESLKTVLKEICRVNGVYATIKDNKLSLQLKNITTEALDKSQHEPVEWKRKTYGINQVVLGSSQIEGEYSIREDKADIEKNGVHKLVINDSMFAYTQGKREALIDGIFNQVKGFGYTPFNLKGEWLNYLEVGDTINIEGVNTLVLRIDGRSPKSLLSGLSAPAIIDSAIEYVNNTEDINNQLKRTEIIVDKNTQEIKETIKKVDNQGSTILEINKSLNGVSEKLNQTTQKTEKIESDLKETNNTITINQQNFDSFKNEEYKNTIGNLQDQIDGAIQFWNGAEIPTLNNYPANEWTTEDKRNNHRADIYTVIKDVNGELKQGKGYRFDKVGNEWKWIELTDNELSAVQKIAEEANKRSKENLGSINTLNEKNVQVDKTLDGLKTEVSETTTKVTNITNTTKEANGNNFLHLTETIKSNPLQLDISIDKAQETTKGYNLTSLNNYEFEFINRVNSKLLLEGYKKNTNYTISFDIKTTLETNPVNIRFYSIGLGNTGYAKDISVNKIPEKNSRCSVTFNTENYDYQNLFIRLPFYSPSTNTCRGTISNLIITEGTEDKPYEPYTGGQPSPNTGYPQEIDKKTGVIKFTSCGKNLIDFSKIKKGFEFAGQAEKTNPNWYVTDYCQVEPNKQYSRNGLSSHYINFYDKNKNWITGTATTNPFTTPQNCYYVRFNSKIEGFDKPQLEMGTQPTSYEPYIETKTPIDLKNNTLLPKDKMGIGYREDLKENWTYINKSMGEKIFNGTEPWILIKNEDLKVQRFQLNFSNNFIQTLTEKGEAYCNMFTRNTNASGWEVNTFFSYSNRIFVVLPLNSMTLEEWKQKLSETNLVVQIELKNEFKERIWLEPLNNILKDKTMLFNDITNMSIDQDNINTYIKYLRKTPLSDEYATNQNLGITNENLNKTNSNLNDVNNNVVNNQTEIKKLSTSITQNKSSIEAEVTELTRKVDTNSNNFQNNIDNINSKLENGVETLRNTLVTIDIEGIKVATNVSAIQTLMSNKEFAIRTNSGKVLAFIGYDEELKKTVARMDNLTVTNYFTAGYHRVERMPNGRTGWFYVRSDI